MRPYAVMWSGGKGGALALTRARARGLQIGALLNFYDAASGRVRFHATRADLVAAQATAARIPLRQHGTSWGEFEGVFAGALRQLAVEGFAGVIFGDIHLADVRAWYERGKPDHASHREGSRLMRSTHLLTEAPPRVEAQSVNCPLRPLRGAAHAICC